VLVGVNLQLLAHWLAIAGGLVMTGAFFLLGASLDDHGSANPSFTARLTGAGAVIGLILLAAQWIVSLGANSFALAATPSRGSRPLAVMGLALTAVVLVNGFAYHQFLVVLSQPGSDASAFDLLSGSTSDQRFTGRLPGTDSLRIALGLASVLSVLSLVSLIDLARLMVVPLFVRSVGQNLRDRGTADSGQTAVWTTAVVFFAALGLEVLFRLRNPTSAGSPADEGRVRYLLVFALAASRLLILLTGVFALRRAKAALTGYLRDAARAEVP
jgi:hypothetical protein